MMCLAAAITAAFVAFQPAKQDHGAAPVAIRYQWTKGDSLTYRFTRETHSTGSAPAGTDKPLESTFKQVSTIHLSVAEVNRSGAATLEWVQSEIRIEWEGAEGKQNYDSTSPDPPTDEYLQNAAIVGQKYEILVDPTGAVRKVTDDGGAADAFAKLVKGRPDAADRIKAFRTFGGGDSTKRAFESAFRFLPPAPVKPGATWRYTAEPYLPSFTIKATGTLQFTAEATEGRSLAHIAGPLTLEVGVPSVKDPTEPVMDLDKVLESAGQADVLVDIGRGRLVRSLVSASATADIVMRAPDGRTRPYRMAVTAKRTVEAVEPGAPSAPAPGK